MITDETGSLRAEKLNWLLPQLLLWTRQFYHIGDDKTPSFLDLSSAVANLTEGWSLSSKACGVVLLSAEGVGDFNA